MILLTPLLVPPPARLLRMLSAVLAVTFTVKLYDLHVGAGAGCRAGFGSFVVFLANIFSLVQRTSHKLPQRDTRQELRQVARAIAIFVPAMVLAELVFRVNWNRYPFALEHAAKVVCFFLVLVPFTSIAGAAWRIAGGHAIDFMDNPFAARTPADFWRRYNRPAHEFLQEDVFKPLAASRSGRARPNRSAITWAALATFAISAVVHEYVFSVPVGRIQGYQTVFFLLQGLGVAAMLRVKPRGWRAVPWVAATFAFNLTTGVLFFASLNHVVPMYQHRLPRWDE